MHAFGGRNGRLSWIYLGILLLSLAVARLAGRLFPLAFAAGGLVGLILSLTPLDFYYGMIAFLLLSAAALVLIPRLFGRRLTPLEGMVGKTCTVVTEKQGHRAGTTIARNSAYRPVALQGNIPAGKALQVRITKAEPFALIGERL